MKVLYILKMHMKKSWLKENNISKTSKLIILDDGFIDIDRVKKSGYINCLFDKI